MVSSCAVAAAVRSPPRTLVMRRCKARKELDQLQQLGDVLNHAQTSRCRSCCSTKSKGNRQHDGGWRRRVRPRPTGSPATSVLVVMLTALLVLVVRPAASVTPGVGVGAVYGWHVRGGGGGGGGGKGGGGAGGGAPTYARSPPRDGVLYDELEVHWGASSREIKKAYYRLAVLHHPDKRPGNAEAEDRFKRVSEAYQILQDDSVRERYHRKGVDSLEEDGLSWGGGNDDVGDGFGDGGEAGAGRGRGRRRIDPMEVFRTFLGGGKFEHLIGPLSPRMIPVRDPDYHHQKSRVLAEDLERRLEVDVRGDSYWFDQAAWAEALLLREQSMGREILHTVGYVYKNYALRSLGKLAPNVLQPQAIRGRIKFYSDQAHRVNNLLAAVSSTTRLYVHLQTRKPEGPSSDSYGQASESFTADEEETVTRVMEALWRVHRVDVEHTVQRACKMVLRDPRMPPSVLKRRAEALMRLGRIFTQAAKGKNPDPGTFRFVENASDPMAGTAAAAPPPFPSSDHGDGSMFASGWGEGDGQVWPPTSDADTGSTGAGLEEDEEGSAGFSSSSSDCEHGAARGSYNRYGGGGAGSVSGDGWAADRGSDGGLETLVGGGGVGGPGGVSPLTPHASACSGVSGKGGVEGKRGGTGRGSARQPIVDDEGEGFGVLGEAWRDTCSGGHEGERPPTYVPEYPPKEYWRQDN